MEKTVAEETELPHVRTLLTTPHFPLLDVRVKPDPDAAAVKVAHVPVVYHVPALMMHPSAFPLVVTWRVPFPLKGVPGLVVGPPLVVVVVVVVGGEELPDFGKYLTPVAGQEDLDPSGSLGIKVPVCTLPATSKKYHISSSSLVFSHWMATSTPRGFFSAARMSAEVYVVVDEGVIPASERNWYEFRVLNRSTVFWKKSGTSSCGV